MLEDAAVRAVVVYPLFSSRKALGLDERARLEDVLVRVRKGKDGKVSNTPVHCLVVCPKSELMEALMQKADDQTATGALMAGQGS